MANATLPGNSTLLRASRAWGWPTRLYLALLAFCVLWQPFELGLYMDDWVMAADAARHGAAFSLERFEFVRTQDPSRPAAAPLWFLSSSLFSDRPFLWHVSLLIINAATALAISRIAALVAMGSPAPDVPTPYLICASTWLVLPWTAAARYWPVITMTAVLLAAFAWLVAWVLKQWMSGRAPMIVPGIVYLYACLAYEAFYLQYLALILTGIGLAMAGWVEMRSVAKTALALTAAQIVAAAWYFASKTLTGVQRPIVGNLREELLRTAWRLFPRLRMRMRKEFDFSRGASSAWWRFRFTS